jgi:hypothetical protein
MYKYINNSKQTEKKRKLINTHISVYHRIKNMEESDRYITSAINFD